MLSGQLRLCRPFKNQQKPNLMKLKSPRLGTNHRYTSTSKRINNKLNRSGTLREKFKRRTMKPQMQRKQPHGYVLKKLEGKRTLPKNRSHVSKYVQGWLNLLIDIDNGISYNKIQKAKAKRGLEPLDMELWTIKMIYQNAEKIRVLMNSIKRKSKEI